MSDKHTKAMRPGPGWKPISGSVYAHISGARVHLGGFVKLPDGRFLNENKWPECMDASMLIKINGGNRKRGLMAWALMLVKINFSALTECLPNLGNKP